MQIWPGRKFSPIASDCRDIALKKGGAGTAEGEGSGKLLRPKYLLQISHALEELLPQLNPDVRVSAW